MKTLDFIIIGAQKCATTTLFELLRQHPEINLPLEKEVPFFTGETCTAGDWEAFAKRYYGDDDGRQWGKATPQYMANSEVPARVAAMMPDTKLIAVLRDPIERSRSHFRMGQRRHTEDRSFDEAMQACMNREAVARARADRAPEHTHGYESEANFYLAWSEYGRILSAYRRHFPKEQLLVLYTTDIEGDPAACLQRILGFLNLRGEGFAPRGLGDVMHAGGGSDRIPHNLRVWLRQRSLIASLWRRVPDQHQGRLRFLYERWNTKKTREPLPLSPETETKLRDHFACDITLLETLGVPTPPWSRAYARKSDVSAVQIANT